MRPGAHRFPKFSNSRDQTAGAATGEKGVFDPSAYQGKVVYLDFWASWCGPCRASFPWLDSLQKKYGPRGFSVVAVNLDRKGKDAAKFLKDLPVSFEILYDPSGETAAQYQLKAMPTAFIYDRNGRVRDSHIGFHKDRTAETEKLIGTLLAEAAPAGSERSP